MDELCSTRRALVARAEQAEAERDADAHVFRNLLALYPYAVHLRRVVMPRQRQPLASELRNRRQQAARRARPRSEGHL